VNIEKELSIKSIMKNSPFRFFLWVVSSVTHSIMSSYGMVLIIPLIFLAFNIPLENTASIKNKIMDVMGFIGLENLSENRVIAISLIGVIAIYFMKNISKIIAIYLSGKIVQKTLVSVQKNTLNKVFSLPFLDFSNLGKGRFIQLLLSDFTKVTLYFKSYFNIISNVVSIFFILSFLLYSSLKMFLVIAVVGMFCMFFVRRLKAKAKKLGKINHKNQLSFNKQLSSIYNNMKLIKLNNLEGRNVKSSARKIEDITDVEIKFHVLMGGLWLVFEGLGILMVCTLLILFNLNFFEQGLSAENFIAFVYLSYKLTPVCTQLLSTVTSQKNFKPSLDHIVEFSNSNSNEIVFGDKELGEFKKISLKDVCYTYVDGQKNILNDFNLNIENGTKVALVGASGSGKSTLLSALLRIIEANSGKVMFDDVDFKDFSKESYYNSFGVITQEPYLFDDTIMANVTLGVEKAEDVEGKVIKALKSAKIYKHFEKTKLGIHSIIGERGIKLSGGERQRLALARLYYKNPAILIFDEATSAMDVDLEDTIQKEINSFVAEDGKTAIFVAHRLSTIKDCDVIYFIKDGKISEQGSFEELIQTSGDFYHYAEISGMISEEKKVA